MGTKKQETRDWELFVDWCASMDDTAPLPTTADTIADFLAAFPAPIEAQGRRVRAIRRAHARAGELLALPSAPRPSALREGAPWASVNRALAQVVKYCHPKNRPVAIRGRRDGWLIVLIGTLGLTRNEARDLVQEDVQLHPRITIKAKPVPKIQPADECPACAVTRWLRIAGDASFGFWSEVQRTISPTDVNEQIHDCQTGLDGLWRKANTLLPAVDRHGWVSADPMSARAISATMARRQTLGEIAKIAAYAIPSGGRFHNATMDEMADAAVDADQKAAAALLRSKVLVDDLVNMLDHLKDLGL